MPEYIKSIFVCFRRALSSTQLQEEGTLPFGGHIHGCLRLEEGASQIRVNIDFGHSHSLECFKMRYAYSQTN